MSLGPMQRNQASSRVDLGYSELFRVAWVTPGSLWTCDSVLGDSRVPSRNSRLLSCLICNTELLCMQYRRIGPHLMVRGKSHGFSQVVVGT